MAREKLQFCSGIKESLQCLIKIIDDPTLRLTLNAIRALGNNPAILLPLSFHIIYNYNLP